jgi:hypothetical protein
VQYAVLAVLLAVVAGIFYFMREPAPEVHNVSDAVAYQGSATFEVEGDVLPTSEANLALRAMDGYDSFTLADETGQLIVYFRPDARRPVDGAHVRVEGSKLPISGQGALGFVAHQVTTSR